MKILKERDIAPNFKLKDQFGKEHSLKDYLGKWVLLYFYPKDDTPGCTKQACEIRDSWSKFKKIKIVVLGISKDSIKSHKKFAEKYNLPFLVLADEEKKVVTEYGVLKKKKFLGKEFLSVERTSFLIDKEGVILKIYKKVNPKNHADLILNDFKNLT